MNSPSQTIEGTSRVPNAGETAAVVQAALHHPPGQPGGFRIRSFQAGPLYVKSALVTPFREVLKPLAAWLMRRHFTVAGEDPNDGRIDLNLKPPSLVAMALTMALAPLIFLLLLPLILILLPAFIVMGLAGMVAASFQSDGHARRLPS